MSEGNDLILTKQQLADYQQFGFLHSIPILSEKEVGYYRAEVEKTCQAVGGRVARLDGLHLFFPWAWELSTHRRLLNCLEQLIGPNILLKSTRLFYKHGRSTSYVGWHQDGVTEKLDDARAPAVWLGITEATVENGCLRVVPQSHRFGLFQHDARPDVDIFADNTTTQVPIRSRAREDELSGKITSIPPDVDTAFDLVMRPGEMSIHHPVILHGSNPNLSDESRIGLSASYSSPELYHGPRPVAWVRGDCPGDQHEFEVINKPPQATFGETVAAYCASDRQILFATG